MQRPVLGIIVAVATALAAHQPAAKTLRWANDSDVFSMDPYARSETFLGSFLGNIYEPLIRRDRELRVEPALAVSWTQPTPTTWRFALRRGVRFHDGTPFDADDVVFSYERARMETSNIKGLFAGIKELRALDAFTVEFTTMEPDPVFIETLTQWLIMDKEWTETNDAVRPPDIAQQEETFATFNANGTGPFMLKERNPGETTVLAAHDAWWDKPQHNLDEVVFRPIPDHAARVDALLADEVDVIQAVPPEAAAALAKNKDVQLVQGHELRTIFLGFDQKRQQLLESNVKGKNPFKDLRVRQAVHQAIDLNAVAALLHGRMRPAGLLVAPGVRGYQPDLDTRLPFDPEAARRLLAEAGYPGGFGVGLDCPSGRYAGDEAVCRAIVAMLARVGIVAELNARPRSAHFNKVLGPEYRTSFYMMAWVPPTYDAFQALYNLIGSRQKGAPRGVYNLGGYVNARVDELLEAIRVETDESARTAMIAEAMRIHRDEIGHIPLYQQLTVWAARRGIQLVQRADRYFPLYQVRMP